jgi:hypothetical protein
VRRPRPMSGIASPSRHTYRIWRNRAADSELSMGIPAQFTTLWANLPQWFEAKEVKVPTGEKPRFKAFPQIPGLNIPIAWETCCIQMSHALNKCGLNVNYSNKLRVLSDSAGREYMLDVAEMRGYLKKHGPPDNIGRVDAKGRRHPTLGPEDEPCRSSGHHRLRRPAHRSVGRRQNPWRELHPRGVVGSRISAKRWNFLWDVVAP